MHTMRHRAAPLTGWNAEYGVYVRIYTVVNNAEEYRVLHNNYYYYYFSIL